MRVGSETDGTHEVGCEQEAERKNGQEDQQKASLARNCVGTAALDCPAGRSPALTRDAKPGELRSPAQPRAAVPTRAGVTYGGFEIDDCIKPGVALQETCRRDSRLSSAVQRRTVLGQALCLWQQLWPPRASSHRQPELLHRGADRGNGLCAGSSVGVFGRDSAIQGRSP